eukprot:g11329.t1
MGRYQAFSWLLSMTWWLPAYLLQDACALEGTSLADKYLRKLADSATSVVHVDELVSCEKLPNWIDEGVEVVAGSHLAINGDIRCPNNELKHIRFVTDTLVTSEEAVSTENFLWMVGPGVHVTVKAPSVVISRTVEFGEFPMVWADSKIEFRVTDDQVKFPPRHSPAAKDIVRKRLSTYKSEWFGKAAGAERSVIKHRYASKLADPADSVVRVDELGSCENLPNWHDEDVEVVAGSHLAINGDIRCPDNELKHIHFVTDTLVTSEEAISTENFLWLVEPGVHVTVKAPSVVISRGVEFGEFPMVWAEGMIEFQVTDDQVKFPPRRSPADEFGLTWTMGSDNAGFLTDGVIWFSPYSISVSANKMVFPDDAMDTGVLAAVEAAASGAAVDRDDGGAGGGRRGRDDEEDSRSSGGGGVDKPAPTGNDKDGHDQMEASSSSSGGGGGGNEPEPSCTTTTSCASNTNTRNHDKPATTHTNDSGDRDHEEDSRSSGGGGSGGGTIGQPPATSNDKDGHGESNDSTGGGTGGGGGGGGGGGDEFSFPLGLLPDNMLPHAGSSLKVGERLDGGLLSASRKSALYVRREDANVVFSTEVDAGLAVLEEQEGKKPEEQEEEEVKDQIVSSTVMQPNRKKLSKVRQLWGEIKAEEEEERKLGAPRRRSKKEALLGWQPFGKMGYRHRRAKKSLKEHAGEIDLTISNKGVVRVSVDGRVVLKKGTRFAGALRRKDSTYELVTTDTGYDVVKQGKVVRSFKSPGRS